MSSKIPKGYYWRDYTGVIPPDALPGGHDANKVATYIGQGLVKNIGILVGTITPGQMLMKVAHGWKAHQVSCGIKILCSSHWNHFSWVNAEKSTLNQMAVGKHLVIGGFENDCQMLNVGRVVHQGQLIVGKVLGYNSGNSPLHFVYGDKENASPNYQVLVYNKF